MTCAAPPLSQACDNYEAALAVKPGCSNALYHWGVAQSDLARCCHQRSPAEAQAHLHLASQKFCASLEHNPGNCQAMNNWGLVLQVRSKGVVVGLGLGLVLVLQARNKCTSSYFLVSCKSC